VARKGELVNTLFEERLFELVGVLHRIARTFEAERIPYELVGGLVVLVHVEEANPEHSTLTRDVDLMVDRVDLDRIKEASAKAGVDTVLGGQVARAPDAVRLVFSGERTGTAVRKRILGTEVMVAPVAELLRTSLSSFGDKDRVLVRSMDAAGLITSQVEQTLPEELAARLRVVRETE